MAAAVLAALQGTGVAVPPPSDDVALKAEKSKLREGEQDKTLDHHDGWPEQDNRKVDKSRKDKDWGNRSDSHDGKGRRQKVKRARSDSLGDSAGPPPAEGKDGKPDTSRRQKEKRGRSDSRAADSAREDRDRKPEKSKRQKDRRACSDSRGSAALPPPAEDKDNKPEKSRRQKERRGCSDSRAEKGKRRKERRGGSPDDYLD